MKEGAGVKPLPNPLLGQVGATGTREQKGEGKEVAGGGTRRPFWFLIGAITIPIVVLDQATKIFVKSHMELYESISVVRNFLDITYTQNPGAAFSMLSEAPAWVREALLMLLASAAIVVLLVLIVRAERVSASSIAFALILGGAAGNRPGYRFRAGPLLRSELSGLQRRRQRNFDRSYADRSRGDLRRIRRRTASQLILKGLIPSPSGLISAPLSPMR
jgi:hypothetical protein